MDRDISLVELTNLVQVFCEARDWDQFHSAKELAIGISTEAGELLERFRFQSDEQIEEMLRSDKRQLVEHELADVLFFVLRLAQRCEIDLKGALQKKIEINGEKYPVDKAKGSNLKYDHL